MRGGLRVTSVTISCPDPRALACFYAELLGTDVRVSEPPWPGQPESAGWAQLRAGAFTLNFEYERAWRTPVWPARPGEQTASQHLDIEVEDLAAAVAWAEDCGARQADVQPNKDVRVMFDPAGHPFCLFT